MIRKVFVFTLFVLILFILLAPKKDAYFQRIAADYGELHQDSRLSAEALMEMGDFEYHHRLLFSHFEYQFGNISVSYYGFLTIIVFDKSQIRERESPQITV